MIKLGEKIKSLRKQKNISAEDLINMLIIADKRLKEKGEIEKANSQFKIAQKVIDAFAEDFVEKKWFKATVYEYTIEQRKEIEELLAQSPQEASGFSGTPKIKAFPALRGEFLLHMKISFYKNDITKAHYTFLPSEKALPTFSPRT